MSKNIKNELGQEIDAERLEKISDNFASGNLNDDAIKGPVIIGRPEPINNKKTTLCVSVPVVMKTRLDDYARDHNCTSSELVRALISRELMNA